MLKHHTAPEAHTAQGSEHTSHLLETSVPLSRKQETRAGGTHSEHHSEHHSTCFQEWRLGRQIFYLEQQKLVKDRKARSCIQPICFPLTTRHHKAVGIFFSNKLTVMVDSYYYNCWGVRSHVIAPGTSNALICHLQQGGKSQGQTADTRVPGPGALVLSSPPAKGRLLKASRKNSIKAAFQGSIEIQMNLFPL